MDNVSSFLESLANKLLAKTINLSQEQRKSEGMKVLVFLKSILPYVRQEQPQKRFVTSRSSVSNSRNRRGTSVESDVAPYRPIRYSMVGQAPRGDEDPNHHQVNNKYEDFID